MSNTPLQDPGPSKTILVVDDDPDIGSMIKMMLEFKGYGAVVMDRAEKVIDSLRDNKVDLIIMDMLLSGVNGVDICKKIKDNPTTGLIPVIMISAHPNAKDICMEAGADDFVSKPFDMDDMLDRVGNLVN
jgi:DNA-binding response OmpR family regulator